MTAVATETAAPARSKVRLDIQALRALAVGCVLAFHLWPVRAPGGYVGVDVFFVVSGFLITGLLVKELEARGRIHLGEFWARRMRRLLPASLLVLLVTLVLAWMFMPSTQWENTAWHVIASAFYVENWLLSFQAVDYMAAEEAATAVQHYWSLSVEEQFYVVWPILLIGVALLARRGWRVWTGVLIAAVTVASFAYSVVLTEASPSAAYFVTPTRAWEFGVGALAAVLPAARLAPAVRAVLAWAGIAAIVYSTFAFTAGTPFPGWRAAIPVAGAIAILVARAEGPGSPMLVGRLRPVQRLGDLSYSVYLWHWPLIIIAPSVLDRSLTTWDKVAIFALTWVLAAWTYRLVEQPLRHLPALARRKPTWSLVAGTVASVAVLAAGLALIASVQGQERSQESLVAQVESRIGDVEGCYAAAALANGPDCEDPTLDGVIAPAPLTAKQNSVDTCMQGQTEPELRVCESGAAPEDATETVAVIGDSHATHWIPAVREIAAEQGWHVVEITKGSCPFTEATRASQPGMAESCDAWNDSAREYVADHPEITRVFTSGSSKNTFSHPAGTTSTEVAIAGYLSTWDALPDTVAHVYVIRDVPRPLSDVLDCLVSLDGLEATLDPVECSVTREEGLLEDPAALAAEQASARVTLADVSDLFCEAELCKPVVGHATVYRDAHHITRNYSESLAPYLAERLGITSGSA